MMLQMRMPENSVQVMVTSATSPLSIRNWMVGFPAHISFFHQRFFCLTQAFSSASEISRDSLCPSFFENYPHLDVFFPRRSVKYSAKRRSCIVATVAQEKARRENVLWWRAQVKERNCRNIWFGLFLNRQQRVPPHFFSDSREGWWSTK